MFKGSLQTLSLLAGSGSAQTIDIAAFKTAFLTRPPVDLEKGMRRGLVWVGREAGVQSGHVKQGRQGQ